MTKFKWMVMVAASICVIVYAVMHLNLKSSEDEVSRELSSIESNEIVEGFNMDEDIDFINSKKLESYKKDMSDFSNSRIVLKDGEVRTTVDLKSFDASEKEDLGFAKKAYKYIRSDIEILDNSKIVVRANNGSRIVIFEHKILPGARGSHYSAVVNMDASSGEVINVIGGG